MAGIFRGALNRKFRSVPEIIDVIEKDLEASDNTDDDNPFPKHAGTEHVKKFNLARRLLAYTTWEIQHTASQKLYRSIHGPHATPLEQLNHIHMGQFDQEDASTLQTLFNSCEEVSWKLSAPVGFATHLNVEPDTKEKYEKVIICYSATPELLAHLTDLLSSIATEIESVLGCYWSVGAVRVFAQRPGTSELSKFHRDNWPPGIRKLYIYPDGAGPKQGSTEFELPSGEKRAIEGGPGTWTIFDNSNLSQRAQCPQQDMPPRKAIEIQINPAIETDATVSQSDIFFGYTRSP